MSTARERLIDAAFELFEDQGFDATTVEDVASRAGTGRTTFFRHFPTKEDAIFPDHDRILSLVDARLATATATTRQTALTEAAGVVLAAYMAEGPRARARYRLTRSVAALRDRERAGAVRYTRLFRKQLRGWLGDQPDAYLRSELVASAVVTAHNHVLRSWLVDESLSPAAARAALRAAMRHTLVSLDPILDRGADRPAVVILRGRDAEALLNLVRGALT